MKLILFSILFTASSALQAGLYFEPYYYKTVFGEFDEKKVPTGNDVTSGDSEAELFGAKLGILWEKKFIVGIEYSQSKTEFKVTGSSAVIADLDSSNKGHTDKLAGTHAGVFAANKYNNAYVWVSGGVSIYRDENANSPIDKNDRYSGFYWGIGMGYELGIIKISAEYRRHDLTGFEDAGTGGSTSLPDEVSGEGKLDNKELFLGASIPIKF